MGLMQTAQMLHEKGWLPEVVMSSNSERTRQTLEAMREAVDAFRYRVFLQQSEWELPVGQHPHKHLCCYAAVDTIWPVQKERYCTHSNANYVLFACKSKKSCKHTRHPLALHAHKFMLRDLQLLVPCACHARPAMLYLSC